MFVGIDHANEKLVNIRLTCAGFSSNISLCKKASNHHANLPLEMYSFTL